VVGARDPPPLFAWEVYPHLYPGSIGRPAPRERSAWPIALALLIASTALLGAAAGLFLWEGDRSLAPAVYRVSGALYTPGPSGAGVPVSGARVTVSGENGFSAVTASNGAGRFAVAEVPAGGIAVRADAPGFAPLTERLFASPAFSSPSGGVSNLTLWLTPGVAANGTNGTTDVVSPFPDLETFVATAWSATALLALGAIVGAFGVYAAARRAHPALAVSGGVAAAIAPVALVVLGLFSLFAIPAALTAVASALGVFAASALAIAMARSGVMPTPDED
jgi:hypothetical protein